MQIVPYSGQYKEAFVELNLAWIRKYFVVEPQDTAMLEQVETFIAQGAAVYFAVEQGTAVAACMVVPREGGLWEICKLATDAHFQGRGAGAAVLKACIGYAQAHGAKRLMIVSNTVLAAAMHLYAKVGFREVPISNQEYERVNIQLEMPL